jgi:hypothetical protein
MKVDHVRNEKKDGMRKIASARMQMFRAAHFESTQHVRQHGEQRFTKC